MTGVTMAEILGDVDGPPFFSAEVKTYPLPSQASRTVDRIAVLFFDALYAVGVGKRSPARHRRLAAEETRVSPVPINWFCDDDPCYSTYHRHPSERERLIDDAECLLVEIRRVCHKSHVLVADDAKLGESLLAMRTCNAMTPWPVTNESVICGEPLHDGLLLGDEDENAAKTIRRLLDALPEEPGWLRRKLG